MLRTPLIPHNERDFYTEQDHERDMVKSMFELGAEQGTKCTRAGIQINQTHYTTEGGIFTIKLNRLTPFLRKISELARKMDFELGVDRDEPFASTKFISLKSQSSPVLKYDENGFWNIKIRLPVEGRSLSNSLSQGSIAYYGHDNDFTVILAPNNKLLIDPESIENSD